MGADAGWKVGREKEASHDHKKAPVFTENTQVDVSISEMEPVALFFLTARFYRNN